MIGFSPIHNLQREMAMATNNEQFDLEEKCPCCHGEGRLAVDTGNGWWTCGECNGAGFVPNAIGERILALMRHNLKPMLQDLQAE